jgi:hypothetical protein
MATVGTERTEGGAGLLDGDVDLAVTLTDGRVLRSTLAHPPGSPQRPPTDGELAEKFAACGSDVPALLKDTTWESARALLLTVLPGKASA